MKLGSETKLDRRNKTKSKNDDDVIWEKCDVIAMFPVCGQIEQSGGRIPNV